MTANYKKNSCFDVTTFQGHVIAPMNAPQAEQLADFILSFRPGEVPKEVHAFGHAMRDAAKEVRKYLEDKRKRNGLSQTFSVSGESGNDEEYLSRSSD